MKYKKFEIPSANFRVQYSKLELEAHRRTLFTKLTFKLNQKNETAIQKDTHT